MKSVWRIAALTEAGTGGKQASEDRSAGSEPVSTGLVLKETLVVFQR